MRLLDLLDHIAGAGGQLAVTTGRLRLSGPARLTSDPAVNAAIREHRDLLVHVVLARATGHVPAPCTRCGELTLTAAYTTKGSPRTDWPRCRFTPGCNGRHEPHRAALTLVERRPAPTQAKPPARPEKRRLLGPMPAWPTSTEEDAA